MRSVYDFDIDKARAGYDETGVFRLSKLIENDIMPNKKYGGFYEYSPAYVVSNEKLPEIINHLQASGKTALSVAGSGDMPLALTANGAVKVDTFDLSYNARIVMDIKTYMLYNKCDYLDYFLMFGSLQQLQTPQALLGSVRADIVKKALSKPDLEYLLAMGHRQIFHDGIARVAPPEWFEKVQRSVPEKYNFIWTDVFDLCGHIENKSYDIIYLSNVMQYVYDVSDITNLLRDLRGHLNPGGTIIVDSLLQNAAAGRHKKYALVGEQISDWADMVYDRNAMTMFAKAR